MKKNIVNGFILTTLLSTTLQSSTLSLTIVANNLIVEKKSKNIKPIIFDINYSNYWHLWANWSDTERKSDEKEYKLFNFLNYGNNWNQFLQKYPNITITTTGQAISQSTFGDVGKNHFGNITFSTKEFYNSEAINYKYLVDASDSKTAAYTVEVSIGVGFQIKDNILSLFPTIYGRITSIGAYTRTLDFGLSINNIIFNPNSLNY